MSSLPPTNTKTSFVQNENLNWVNKDISRKLFEANQRGEQLALNLGFKDLFEAYTVVSRDPAAFSRFRIEQQTLQVRRLEKELEAQQAINASLQKAYQDVLEILQRVKEDNESLRAELDQRERKMMSSPSGLRQNTYVDFLNKDTVLSDSDFYSRTLCDALMIPDRSTSSHNAGESLPAYATSLQLELKDLRRRYDSLLEAKEKAAARYKSDYKKWRDFKREIHEQLTRDSKNEYNSGRFSAKRKRCNEDTMEPHCTLSQ